jgi:hypothetical protein
MDHLVFEEAASMSAANREHHWLATDSLQSALAVPLASSFLHLQRGQSGFVCTMCARVDQRGSQSLSLLWLLTIAQEFLLGGSFFIPPFSRCIGSRPMINRG